MVRYTDEQIVNLILTRFEGKKIYILAPVVKNRKGHYKELFENIRKKGYLQVRTDGELREIIPNMKLDRYKNHSIEVVIAKLKVSDKDRQRLFDSVETALKTGDKQLMILDAETGSVGHYSMTLMDPKNGLSYADPSPHNFSFNSPQGYCPCCKGLGTINVIDRQKLIPDETVSIYKGGIAPLGKYNDSILFAQIEAICQNTVLHSKRPSANSLRKLSMRF